MRDHSRGVGAGAVVLPGRAHLSATPRTGAGGERRRTWCRMDRMEPTTSGLIETNGIEVWAETFGAPSDAAVVLISGADSPGSRWDLDLVDALVRAHFRVVRFDNRDSGLSTKIDPDELFTLDDMARDVVGLLDALGIARAHIVGRSMGGMIGQLLALDHPERVRSLALLISSPGLGDER